MAFCPIAYGAKGLFYFTYETTRDYRTPGFRDAIIDTDGTTPMPIYNTVLTINKYITKIIGPVVMNSINLGAFHKSNAPTGENTTDHSVDHRIDSNTPLVAYASNPNMLIVIFREKADISKYYVFAVNKDTNAESQSSTIKLRGDYRNYVSFAPSVINYNGDTTFTSATSIQCTYNSTDSLTTVTLPKLLEGGEGFLIKVVGLQLPARINDIKVYGNRVYIAHNRGVTMINKTTGERKDVHDGTAYTPAVRVEIDGTRVYICQDSGTNGNLVYWDLDLNGMGLVYNDYGLNTRVTSVAFSGDKIFVGQQSSDNGNVVVLRKSDYVHIDTWARGYLVNDVKYQGDENKSIVVAHKKGIIRISTDVGNAGDSLASFDNGHAYTPATDIVLRSDAVFGALASSNNGLLYKLDQNLTEVCYWNENELSPRVLKLALNSDQSKITAAVIRPNGQGAFRTFNTSDLSLMDSCFVSDPRSSSYEGNSIYLGSGSMLYQTPSVGIPSVINFSASISGRTSVSHPSIRGRYNEYTWTANVTGGTAPYSYIWKWNGYATVVITSTYKMKFWGDVDPGSAPFTLTVQITDANGRLATGVLNGTEYHGGMQKQSLSSNDIPTTFAFYPNYPNPFNPATEIKFDLPEPARVKIVIYDLLGREIMNLFDGMKEAGYHSIRWNSSDQRGNKVSSGIYFCRINLRGENGQQYNKVLKMLLTK
jgi:hypothetical protein